jgi:hypothetical protein
MRNIGGGVGGEDAAHGESEIGGRNMEDRICPWFFVIYGELVRSSPPLCQKMELVLTYEAFYAR